MIMKFRTTDSSISRPHRYVQFYPPQNPSQDSMKDSNTMAARAVLSCRPNSHPFQDRSFPLEQPVKIGRSVARSRPNGNNAIFDCKVLSRNHALLWYENGKFFLQDTKSSNGTFVNNQRLSKSSEESLPFQVSSGDIIQFGVDVMEVTKKDPNNTDSMIDAVTHGCIVATLQLYLPDGKEAKASSSTQLIEKSQSSTLEIYQINQVVKEALQREQMIDSKLASLNQLLGSTKGIMANSWKALINEDRLLSKVDSLQRQLHATHKSVSEDKLREEITQLHEDKEKYQALAKQKLKDLAMEKLEAMKRVNELERTLSDTEEERTILKELCDRTNKELSLVAQKYDESEKKASDLLQEMNESTENYKNELDRLNKCVSEEEEAMQKKQQMIDMMMAKLDSQNTIVNPIKALNNSSVDGVNVNDIVEQESDLNLTSIVNSQHNNNSLVEPQISANMIGDSNHINSRSPTDVPTKNTDRVDSYSKLQHVGNELVLGGVDLQQLNSNLTDLLNRFEDFRKLHIDSNYSEAISQLISKVSRDVHQIKNITNSATLLHENEKMADLNNQNSTTINYNKKTIELNRLGSDEQKDVDEDEKKIDEDEKSDAMKRQKNSGNHSNTIGDDDATLTQILAESREQVNRLLGEKAALQERVETLGAYLSDYTRKYDVYKAEAQHLEQANGEQAVQLLALKEQLSNSEKAYAELQAAVKANKEIIQSREETILKLKVDLSALEEYKTEQDQRVALLRSQIDDLSRARQKVEESDEDTYQRNSTPKKNQSADLLNASTRSSECSSSLCERRCSFCCNATAESQNEMLRTQINLITSKMLETEEELCIYKDQYNKSSSDCSKLERQLQDQQNLVNGPQWTSIRFTVPVLILILAILIAFHPST